MTGLLKHINSTGNRNKVCFQVCHSVVQNTDIQGELAIDVNERSHMTKWMRVSENGEIEVVGPL